MTKMKYTSAGVEKTTPAEADGRTIRIYYREKSRRNEDKWITDTQQ